MKLLKLNIFFLLLWVLQSCSSTSQTLPRSPSAHPRNCSEQLINLVDLEHYREEIYASNVINYHKYRNGKARISKSYLDDPRFANLSKDPDHNFKVTMTSKLEAVSGIEAERLGLIASPIARGPPGSEFIDGHNKLWDVKTPISPLARHSWSFKPEEAGNSVLKKLKKNKKMHILLNKSYMSFKDKESLEDWIKKNIPKKMHSRIKEVYFDSPFVY